MSFFVIQLYIIPVSYTHLVVLGSRTIVLILGQARALDLLNLFDRGKVDTLLVVRCV